MLPPPHEPCRTGLVKAGALGQRRGRERRDQRGAENEGCDLPSHELVVVRIGAELRSLAAMVRVSTPAIDKRVLRVVAWRPSPSAASAS